MNVHVIKREFIVGPSGSSVRHLISNASYLVCKDEESVALTFEEIKHLKKTLSALIKREKSLIKIKKDGK